MKGKYKQRVIMVIFSIITMISVSTSVLAESTVGQQTISNKGTYFRVESKDGKTGTVYVESDGGSKVYKNHDLSKPLPVTVRHDIPLPDGTVRSNLSFKEEDIRGYGKAGDLFNNGHTNVKNGNDMLDKTGASRSKVINYEDHGVIIDKNGKSTHGYTVQTVLTPEQMMMSSLPDAVLDRAKMMTAKNDDSPKTINARYQILLQEWNNNNNGTHNRPPTKTLMEMATNPQLFKNSISGMLQTVAVAEVMETDRSRLKEPTPNPGPGSCPTEFEALRSRREYLYTDYTTTDLPTPPTRNHGGCPSQDNEGFWNYTDEPAWGQNFFPVAAEGEHFKFWKPETKDKGYNKSIHYEKRPVGPGIVSTDVLGRPVKTTVWTPEERGPYRVFLNTSKGQINHTWIDNRGNKDAIEQKKGSNITRYCVEAYEKLLIPKKQKWKHEWYQYYEWYDCWDERKEDSPAFSECTGGWSTSYDSDGNERGSSCDGWTDYPVGYRYKKGDHYNQSKTAETDAGIKDDITKDVIIPPVYEPWRVWKHRAEVEVEFHASMINTDAVLLNFNKLTNPKVKSGYGVLQKSKATLVTDWDRTILPSAYILRPNKTTPIKLEAINKEYCMSSPDNPCEKTYVRDPLRATGSGGLIEWSTQMGKWFAHRNTKGGIVIPKYGDSRQHFIHLDYPDGEFKVESWGIVDLKGGTSPWRVRYADVPGIPVDGNMFSDQFVRPK